MSSGSDGVGGRHNNDSDMRDSSARQQTSASAASQQARQTLIQLLQPGNSGTLWLDALQRSRNSQAAALEQAIAVLPLLQQTQHQPQHSLNNISSLLNNAADLTTFSNQLQQHQQQQRLSNARIPQQLPQVDSVPPHPLDGLARLLQLHQTSSPSAGAGGSNSNVTTLNSLASDLTALQQATTTTSTAREKASRGAPSGSGGRPSSMPTAARQPPKAKQRASGPLQPSEEGTIVTCRARGISKDHNKKTAYFVIPDNVKHGADLLCSHAKCQNKGIRFVFCIVCDEPVAKINFKTRHSHPDVLKKKPQSTNSNNSSAATSRQVSSSAGSVEGKSSSVPVWKRKDSEGKASSTGEPAPSLLPASRVDENYGSSKGTEQNRDESNLVSSSTSSRPESQDGDDDEKLKTTSNKNQYSREHMSGKISRKNKLEHAQPPSSHGSSSTSSSADEEQESEAQHNRRRHKELLSSLPKSIGAPDTQESLLPQSHVIASLSSSRKRKAGHNITSGGSNSSYESLYDENDAEIRRRLQGNTEISDIQNQWIRLLNERPNTKKRKRMKAWLARILSFSECMAADFTTSSSSDDATSSPDRSDDGIAVN